MIYKVTINTTPPSTVFVRADNRASARVAATARLITLDRASEDEILDLKRSDVLDSAGITPPTDDEQAPLPLATPDQE